MFQNLEEYYFDAILIVAMTANAFDDDIKMSFDAGMNAHLAKPIEPEKLFDTLNKLLSES